jgi:5'-3' exonuclease
MPAYTHAGRHAWEGALIEAVLSYIRAMTRLVAPTEGVYVAVDGVAPMAKIRQQRARRFKSAIAAEEEAAVRRSVGGAAAATSAAVPVGDRWDSNAITPGTAFMSRLTATLYDFKQVDRIPVRVSPADKAGEGEQKIMEYLRANPAIRNVVVYGLDADLIVLALLEHGLSGRTVDLFREETEFNGAVKRDGVTGEEQYLYLHVKHLAAALHGAWAAPGRTLGEFLVDFAACMNLLGNDFVSHGIALKINDRGIETVLEVLRGFTGRLVNDTDRTYNWGTLSALFAVLAANEERGMLKNIRKKLEARVGATGATTAKDEVSRALARMNDRPVEWAAERVWVTLKAVQGEEKLRWEFREDWRDQYYKHGLWGASPADAVRDYMKTLQWTLAYYLGAAVDPTWYYPWLLPPLLSDLVQYAYVPDKGAATHVMGINTRTLQPLEQLAMVLPVSSFHLLPAELQTLPARYPHAWPESWDTFSLGRRFLWECEPLIPLVQPRQIMRWVDECLEEGCV